MSQHKITPEKVTRPIQLLAAWLTGLIIIDCTFLTAATQIKSPTWGSGALLIAAIINVPIFLFSIFLLQTKFRPEMQEDSYYYKYLENQYNANTKTINIPNIEEQVKEITKNILEEVGSEHKDNKEDRIQSILLNSQMEFYANQYGGSRSLSELFKAPKFWHNIVNEYKTNDSFINDIESLINNGLATKNDKDYYTCKLTKLGMKVAKYAQERQLLFAQNIGEYWDIEHSKVS